MNKKVKINQSTLIITVKIKYHRDISQNYLAREELKGKINVLELMKELN